MTAPDPVPAAEPTRDIPFGHAACTVCDEVVALAMSKARIRQPVPIFVHGPRGNRCPGGGIPGKRWVDAQGLPLWEDMSDLDRGCVLLFLWKVHWERSYSYARENYPCRYLDDPRLAALGERDACRHASQVAGTYREIGARLGHDEFQRLYNLALDIERARWEARRATARP